MDRRLSDLEGLVEELSENVRFLEGEVRRLQRLVEGDPTSRPSPTRGGGSGSASRSPGRYHRLGEVQSRGSVPSLPGRAASEDSFEVLTARTFNQDGSRSRSGYSTPGALSDHSGQSHCSLSWEEREAVCEEIAGWVRRCLDSSHRGSSGRDRIHLPSRIWIVARSCEGDNYNPVTVCRTFGACKRLVKRGEDCGDSIFVGLPSIREAQRVVSFAGLQWPQQF